MEYYSLVFNVGSGSVTGAIIRFTEKQGVDILYSAREIIPPQAEPTAAAKRLTLLQGALSTLAAKLLADGLKPLNVVKGKNVKIDRAFYLFSSPWSRSQTMTVRIKEGKAFKVTDAYLEKVVGNQERQWPPEQGKIIEKKIVQIRVNGYVVSDVGRQLARELEVSLFFTAVPPEILRGVEEAVGKTFMIKHVWCHSLALSIFSILRDLFPAQDDFVHIDVGDELTDLAVIKDGVVISGASFPLGRNYFVADLAKNLQITADLADSQMRLQALNKNDELATLKLSVAMNKAAGAWQEKMTAVLQALREKIYVPETLFLIAGTDLVPFIALKLSGQDFKVRPVDIRHVTGPATAGDLPFKIGLSFIDKLYKI